MPEPGALTRRWPVAPGQARPQRPIGRGTRRKDCSHRHGFRHWRGERDNGVGRIRGGTMTEDVKPPQGRKGGLVGRAGPSPGSQPGTALRDCPQGGRGPELDDSLQSGARRLLGWQQGRFGGSHMPCKVGNPNSDAISTFYVERHNLTMRMSMRPVRPPNERLQQEDRQSLPRPGSLLSPTTTGYGHTRRWG